MWASSWLGCLRKAGRLTRGRAVRKYLSRGWHQINTLLRTWLRGQLYARLEMKCARPSLSPLQAQRERGTSHARLGISISLWEFVWDFDIRRYTIVHGFCCFLAVFCRPKELLTSPPVRGEVLVLIVCVCLCVCVSVCLLPF